MSEMGVIFAPNVLFPAETQGYSGFNVAAEFGWTGVNTTRTSKDQYVGGEHYYWRAAESVSSRAFLNPIPPPATSRASATSSPRASRRR